MAEVEKGFIIDVKESTARGSERVQSRERKKHTSRLSRPMGGGGAGYQRVRGREERGAREGTGSQEQRRKGEKKQNKDQESQLLKWRGYKE